MCSACVREAIYGVWSVEFPKGGLKYSEIFMAFEGCENASLSLDTKASRSAFRTPEENVRWQEEAAAAGMRSPQCGVPVKK